MQLTPPPTMWFKAVKKKNRVSLSVCITAEVTHLVLDVHVGATEVCFGMLDVEEDSVETAGSTRQQGSKQAGL
ncbi:hypothetical protein DSO57_1017814 [Entomophthora muscae]|uniref:Uncharacterized protein n=1 Tax=Entomophthora muscae TaxID=34485 RepID=A0ACC2SH72_9FUNG|nr:hypothetical protein DSO57_1017814 [Entomophthora muscae]